MGKLHPAVKRKKAAMQRHFPGLLSRTSTDKDDDNDDDGLMDDDVEEENDSKTTKSLT